MYFFYGEGVSIGFCFVETIEFFGTKVERLGSKVEPRFRKVEQVASIRLVAAESRILWRGSRMLLD